MAPAYPLDVAEIFQINTSKGGVPKRPVPRALIDELGVVGDEQNDRAHHGGPDRAICLYSLEVIDRLREEGHSIQPGYAGENLTVSGLDWNELVPGTRLSVGDDVLLEITSHAAPCAKNAQWFEGGDFTRILQRRHPGESRLYARVLRSGQIEVGDEVEMVADASSGHQQLLEEVE